MELTKGDVKEIGRNSQKTRNENGSSTQRRWLDEAKTNKISFDVILVSPTEKYLRGTLELDVTQASTVTVAELKTKIQNQFSVPTYDQKVTFGSMTLEDVDTLFSHRLVDGDILTVEYSYAVDTENITGADPGILEGGWLDLGLIKRGGCGRGICPLPREARKFFTEGIDILCMKT